MIYIKSADLYIGEESVPDITVQKEAEKFIIIDSQWADGTGGWCFACEAWGLIDRLGYPHNAQNIPKKRLQHKAKCPMNKVLNLDGSIKF